MRGIQVCATVSSRLRIHPSSARPATRFAGRDVDSRGTECATELNSVGVCRPRRKDICPARIVNPKMTPAERGLISLTIFLLMGLCMCFACIVYQLGIRPMPKGGSFSLTGDQLVHVHGPPAQIDRVECIDVYSLFQCIAIGPSQSIVATNFTLVNATSAAKDRRVFFDTVDAHGPRRALVVNDLWIQPYALDKLEDLCCFMANPLTSALFTMISVIYFSLHAALFGESKCARPSRRRRAAARGGVRQT